MFSIRFRRDDYVARINTLTTAVDSTQRAILDECSTKLVGLAGMYFDNLSRGGASYSGRRWPAPSKATVAKRLSLARSGRLRAPVGVQGIVTGEMRQSLRASVENDRIRLNYESPQARFFTVHRRLLPTRLPTVWRDACDEIAQAHIDRATQ